MLIDDVFEPLIVVFQVGKILSDFPQEDTTTDESAESTDDKKSEKLNEENEGITNAEEIVESSDVSEEKLNSDSTSVEMVNVDAAKKEIETDNSELEGAVKSEVNGDVISEVNIENVLEDVDPLSSADSQVQLQSRFWCISD